MFKDTGYVAFSEAGEDLEAARRVKLNSTGQVVYADADDAGIGVTRYASKTGEAVSVGLWNKPGTFEIEAAGDIDFNTVFYAAADGKVQTLPVASGTYIAVGRALEEATANGDIIEGMAFTTGATKTVSG